MTTDIVAALEKNRDYKKKEYETLFMDILFL